MRRMPLKTQYCEIALEEDSFAYVNAITIQNPTLKHYTRYETPALKNTVLAM